VVSRRGHAELTAVVCRRRSRDCRAALEWVAALIHALVQGANSGLHGTVWYANPLHGSADCRVDAFTRRWLL
jgi:hypothetical protein